MRQFNIHLNECPEGGNRKGWEKVNMQIHNSREFSRILERHKSSG